MAPPVSTQSFVRAPDGVEPKKVPQKTVYTGAKIPAIGLGTFGSDRVSGEKIAKAVLGAASVGYRHFDCAAVYGNENLIGFSLRKILEGGVGREELWITSKLWNDKHAEGDVIAAFEKSLHDLQLDPIHGHRIGPEQQRLRLPDELRIPGEGAAVVDGSDPVHDVEHGL